MNNGPLLVVLSGPSGVGKDSILDRMRAQGRPFHFTVTATTRPPRSGEHDGIDYFFFNEERFQQLVGEGGFLEHAAVYAHHSGVPKGPVLAALSNGQDVIMRVDVQGALSIRAEAPGAVLIFVAPPSEESLMERLRRRDTDSAADVALRLGKVQEEMATLPHFDYVVVNDEGELDTCVATIEAIVTAEKCRVERPPLGLVGTTQDKVVTSTRDQEVAPAVEQQEQQRASSPPRSGFASSTLSWEQQQNTSGCRSCVRMLSVTGC